MDTLEGVAFPQTKQFVVLVLNMGPLLYSWDLGTGGAHTGVEGPKGYLSSEGYIPTVCEKQLARDEARPTEPRWTPAVIILFLTKIAGSSECLTEVPGGRGTSQPQRKSPRNPGS